MNFIHDTMNGTPVLRLKDETCHLSFDYYSANKWVDDHRLVIARSTYRQILEFQAHAELVLVDIAAETERLLLSDVLGEWVVHGTKLYYIHLQGDRKYLCRLDVDSGEQVDYGEVPHATFPHITADGRYLNWSAYPDGRKQSVCWRLNTETGERERLFEKHFAKPFEIANHMMIHPQNPDQVFFAHEGDTFYVSNRLWLFDKAAGMHPLAKQRLDKEGNLGDCFGHECWAADGKGLYFVKYACSPLPPRGICYVSITGEQTDVLYGKYPYWHVSAAPNGRYLAADTQSGGFSGVCLIDTATGRECMPIEARTTWQHPCHPHPAFSPDSRTLGFQDLDGERITLCFLDVETALNKE